MHKAAVVQFEITGRDSTALKRFYGSLFGWDMRQTPTPGYRLTAMSQNGIPGAVGTSRNGGSPQLTFYVEVDDIQEHLSYAEELGGRIVRQPYEVGSPEGRFTYAFFADPEGNVVGLSTGLEQALAHTQRVSGLEPPQSLTG
jgi:predicted enzyme related to lactoylglutathione lyase